MALDQVGRSKIRSIGSLWTAFNTPNIFPCNTCKKGSCFFPFSLERHTSKNWTVIQPLSLRVRPDGGLYKTEACPKQSRFYADEMESKTNDITISGLINDLQNRIKTIPFKYLDTFRNLNSTCGRLPKMEGLRMNNDVWQRFEHTHITLYLYSAHLDVRELNSQPTIRVFVTMSKPEIGETEFPFCQIWHEGVADPVVVRSNNFQFTGWDGIWNKTDQSNMNTPHMFDCPIQFG